MAAAEAIRAQKRALRAAIKKRLHAMSAAEKVNQSQYVADKLLSHPVYLQSSRVSIYLSTAYEISTLPILKNIFQEGKTCFVPKYVQGNRRMDMVRLYSMEDFQSLPSDSWEIRVPTGDRENAMETGGVDLVIVPCAGITEDGVRLGHGKGYYDAFLTQAKATTIAPVFREQIEQEIPTEDHDVKIDHVLFMPFES